MCEEKCFGCESFVYEGSQLQLQADVGAGGATALVMQPDYTAE